MRQVIIAIALLASSLLQAGNSPSGADRADDLLVVHCLLPGQVRQLGQRTTYMSPRRPVRTTAVDCRSKGGEYVLQDKASLRTAMRVWLDAADAGDAEAQTTLGELFEQGMGLPPDYEVSRYWYEKAANQGYARALTNLGNLYERGLGVERDGARALQLYRRASGLPAKIPEAVVIDQAPDVAPIDSLLQAEVAALQATLDSLQLENSSLRKALSDSTSALQQAALRSEQDERAAREAGASEAEQAAQRVASESLAAHARQVERYRQTLENRDATIVELQAALVSLRKDRSQYHADTERMAEELTSLSMLIDQQRKSLLESQRQLIESGSTANQLRTQLEQQQEMLARSEAEAAQSVAQVQDLLAEVERLREESEDAKSEPAPVTEQALLAGPQLTLVDPVMPTTRGLVKVRVPSPAQTTQRIVGRVTAPAGLLSLTVNNEIARPNAAGVFIYELRGTPEVQVTAIDQQGKRADLRFEFARQEQASPAAPTLPDVNLGKFHALLIGNSRYRYLPQLETPNNDIDQLDRILTERYDFDVQVLRDATRYEMLSALNDLRAKLTSNDNLLIYYAGHGELDRTNMRGHWLPVDAEPSSTANWISNVAITDILNVINARQIMLVVDSCYSGTLTRSSLTNLSAAMTDAERKTWLELMADKKARVVLTSGGLAPVMDAGGGGHSVFARAFLDVLQSNADLMTGRSLYEAIAARVAHAASKYEFEQIPAYAPIARSGHEAGDFMMLPTSL